MDTQHSYIGFYELYSYVADYQDISVVIWSARIEHKNYL